MKNLSKFFILSAIFALLTGCGESGKENTTPDIKKEEAKKVENLVVFYEANPKVFATSKSLNAISDRLPEIQKLGTTVLWLMPINQLGSKNAVGSPYCVRDYKAVNPSYGSNDDLKALIKKAHGMGMSVVMDWVANHTSWDHAWITAHPDWYTQKNGQIISPEGTGWNDVADLNYNNKQMRAAMIDALVFWVKEIGIDGYRCDAVDYVPVDFWTEAIKAIREVKKDAIMLAESSDKKYFTAGFNYAYGWPYQNALKALFAGGKLETFYTKVQKEAEDLPSGTHLMRFITNHDQASENAPSKVYGSNEAALAAHVITTFIGEYPLIYSSQEIGYSKALNFFNNNVLDWNSNKAYTDSYQKIMGAAVESQTVRYGKPVCTSISGASVIQWKNGPENLLVIVNPTKNTISAKMPMEKAGSTMKNLVSGQSESVPNVVELGAYEYRIWFKK